MCHRREWAPRGLHVTPRQAFRFALCAEDYGLHRASGKAAFVSCDLRRSDEAQELRPVAKRVKEPTEPAGDLVPREGWRETPDFLVCLKALGRTIRRHREHQELTLEQASERMGLDYRHLAKIEGGSLNATTFTLFRVARGLGVSLEALLTSNRTRTTPRRG